VGCRGGHIVALGDLSDSPTERRINVGDLVIAPGFIDTHVHSEIRILRDPTSPSDAFQGVTTHIVGQDGVGFAPSDAATVAFFDGYFRPINGHNPIPESAGVGSFLARYDGHSSVNIATLIPNGAVRHMVMRNENRVPNATELETMISLCRTAMDEGALGLSTGLDYVPSGFASTDELVTLCAALASRGAVYVSHVRYRSGLKAAVEEAIEIGRRAKLPVHISHLLPEEISAEALLAMIDRARREGCDVTFDTYPYTFGCTTLLYVMPLWVLEGNIDEIERRLGDRDVRTRIQNELGDSITNWSQFELAGELREIDDRYIGTDLLGAARASGKDPVDFVCDLLLSNRLEVLVLGLESNDPVLDRGLETLLRHPAHMACSDAVYARGRIHPRVFGAFARFAGPFVRDFGCLTLEEAVRHMTAAPARRFGLYDRGLIRPGMAADLVVFDPSVIADRSTRREPNRAVGVHHVFVTGTAVLSDGELTDATPGQGLRHRRAWQS
jgi:N-acyl-D-amino-acid deacylase